MSQWSSEMFISVTQTVMMELHANGTLLVITTLKMCGLYQVLQLNKQMKRISIVTLLTVTTVLLTSCFSNPESLPPLPVEENQSSAIEYTQLRKVGFDSSIPVSISAAKTKSGMYYVDVWPLNVYEKATPWDCKGNIIYIDYESHRKIYLCNVPGCAHNTEDCASYVSFSRGICMFTNSSETVLFYMSQGAADGEVYSEDDIGRIVSMKMDGTDRRELIRLKSTQSFLTQDPIFADDNYLILPILDYCKTDVSYRTLILSIDINTGSSEILLEYPGQCSLRDIMKSGEFIIQSYSGVAASETVITKVSDKDHQTVLFSSSSVSPMVNDGKIIIVEQIANEANITVKDIETETESLYSIGSIPETRYPVFVFGLVDGMAHLTYYSQGDGKADPHELYVSLSDGNTKEKELTYNNGVENRYVYLIASSSEKYLVGFGSEIQQKTYIGKDGIPHIGEVNEPKLAMIAKEDYWNNIPNYEFIS